MAKHEPIRVDAVVKEALAKLGRKNTAMLHYRQVFPLHIDTAEYIDRSKRAIVIENNATGQLRKVIRLYAGIDVNEGLVKYDGLSFAVEEVMEGLKAIDDG